MKGRPIAAFLILLALILALFGDVLFLRRGAVLSQLGADLSLQFVFMRDFGFRELAHGNIALWNPYIYGGMPFLGVFQPALLYPPNLIYLILPLDRALNIDAAIHLLLLGFFTYLWISRRGASAGAALLGSVLATFGSAVFYHVTAGHWSLLASTAWAPLVFLAVDLILGGSRAAGVLLGIAAFALQILAGHPQTAFTTAIAAGFLIAAALPRARGRVPILLALLALYAGGAALAMVQLGAGVDAASESLRGRSGLPYSEAISFSFPPENLVTLLAPKFFGAGLAAGGVAVPTYWGRGYAWEMTLFIGVAGLFLAVYGALRGERVVVRGAAIALVGLLVLALGGHTPLFRPLHAMLPAFRSFRGPSKFIVPASLLLALLAAAGWDRLRRERERARPQGEEGRGQTLDTEGAPHPEGVGEAKRARSFRSGRFGRARGPGLALAAATLLLAAIAFAIAGAGSGGPSGWWGRLVRSVSTPSESYLPRASLDNAAFLAQTARHAAVSLGTAAVVTALLAAALSIRRAARWPAPLIAAVAVVEVLAFAISTRPTFPLAPVLHPEWLSTFRAGHPGDFRVLHAENEDNAFIAAGVHGLWGYDPNVSRRYGELMYLTQGLDPSHANYFLRFTAHHPLHRMLRWRYLVSSRALGGVVQEFDDPLPRAFLVGTAAVVEGRDAILGALTDPAFDPRRVVVLESAPNPPPESPPVDGSGGSPGDVRLTDVSTDEVLIEAEVARPSILVITDAYSAGWRAVALPGSAQSVYSVMPANYVLRAVPLAAGNHRFRLEYAPRGFRVGRWVTLGALLGYAAALAAWWRGRRRRGHSAAETSAAADSSAMALDAEATGTSAPRDPGPPSS